MSASAPRRFVPEGRASRAQLALVGAALATGVAATGVLASIARTRRVAA